MSRAPRTARPTPALIPLLLALAAAPAGAAQAAPPAATTAGAPQAPDDSRPPVAERQVDTRHSVTVDGRALDYTATAGTLTLRDAAGTPRASLFYVAYVADRAKGAPPRPLTFFYNGGPGSSSIWLHMASFAPVRVGVEAPAADAAAPSSTPPSTPVAPAPGLAPNPDTLLGATDMVFLDAVGTGYSEPFAPEDGKLFWGNDPDANSFAQAIRRYIAKNDRWSAPVYLFGESYGTTRSAILSRKLLDDGLRLDGIVLMSSILNFAQRAPGLDRMAINQVPTYAATAWVHGKAGKGEALDAWVARARRFAAGPYTAALAQGHALPDAERDAVAAEMATLTGLSPAYVAASALRVMPERYRKEVLRDEGRVLGEFDTRFTGFEADGTGADATSDPANDAISAPVIGRFRAYIENGLHYRTGQRYQPASARNLMAIWDWSHRAPDGSRQNAMADVALDLADTMRRNPAMRVLSLSGYYDLSTPFFATEYDLSHMLLPPALRPRLIERHYASGHMIYLDPQSRAAVRRDVAAFLAGATLPGS